MARRPNVVDDEERTAIPGHRCPDSLDELARSARDTETLFEDPRGCFAPATRIPEPIARGKPLRMLEPPGSLHVCRPVERERRVRPRLQISHDQIRRAPRRDDKRRLPPVRR